MLNMLYSNIYILKSNLCIYVIEFKGGVKKEE